MQSIYQVYKDYTALLNKALKPTYTLDIDIRPDDPNSTTELDMVDDDGNIRVHIGKLDDDYGMWISRRGFNARTASPKYLSFTASMLTPRLKYAGQVIMSRVDLEFNEIYETEIIFPREYASEIVSIVGVLKVVNTDNSVERTDLKNPRLLQDFSYNGTYGAVSVSTEEYKFYVAKQPMIWDSFTSTYIPRPIESMTLEYFIFSDK